jgi:hypothetical protein
MILVKFIVTVWFISEYWKWILGMIGFTYLIGLIGYLISLGI